MGLSGSRLDDLLPAYDFSERHSRTIDREPHAVYHAFRALTPRELPLSRLLFAVRSLPGRLVGAHGLPSQVDLPLLDQFLDLGFVVLADVRPPSASPPGATGPPWPRPRPGWWPPIRWPATPCPLLVCDPRTQRLHPPRLAPRGRTPRNQRLIGRDRLQPSSTRERGS
jgi:hypothetical protein